MPVLVPTGPAVRSAGIAGCATPGAYAAAGLLHFSSTQVSFERA